MDEEQPNLALNETNFYWALCFEVGLGVFALMCGYVTNVWPGEFFPFPPSIGVVLIGIASALPALATVLTVRRLPWKPIQEFNQLVEQKLIPMFGELGIGQLAAISIAAGVGEELLFRGLIQREVAFGSTPVVGVLIASFVFGLVHAMSLFYFITAFMIGLYFGWIFHYTESLWVPVMGHAAYDFLMLIWLRFRGGEIADQSDA